MTANSKENELKIYKDILEKSNSLKNRFIKFFENTLKENDVSSSIFDANVLEIIKSLIFGVEENSNIAKVDVGKNRNLIKHMFLNLPNIYKVACVYKDLVIQFEEYLNLNVFLQRKEQHRL